MVNDSSASYDETKSHLKVHNRQHGNHTNRHYRKEDTPLKATNFSDPKETIHETINSHKETEDDLKLPILIEEDDSNSSSTPRSRKSNRKHKPVDIEEDGNKNQRKRKNHVKNGPKNNTLLTNSVNDNILNLNFSENANSVHRHHHQREKVQTNNLDLNEPEIRIDQSRNPRRKPKHRSEFLNFEGHAKKRKPGMKSNLKIFWISFQS